ncbi:hypothetical protein QOT17_007231 [Balamuthia mandrillaris]
MKANATTGLATKNAVGGVLGWSAFSFLLLSLLVPWYVVTWTTTTTDNFVNHRDDCKEVAMFFWSTILCQPSPNNKEGSYCPRREESPCFQLAISNFWTYHSSNDEPFPLFEQLTPIFATSLFLMLFVTMAALLVALLFTVRCCCMNKRATPLTLNLGTFVFAAVGFIILSMTIIYFAAAMPNAFRKGLVEDDLYYGEGSHGEGPWSSFIGKGVTVGPDSSVKSSWSAAGWWLALLAWPFYLSALVTLGSLMHHTHEAEGYAVLHPKV